VTVSEYQEDFSNYETDDVNTEQLTEADLAKLRENIDQAQKSEQ
jgi:hypothetical protein